MCRGAGRGQVLLVITSPVWLIGSGGAVPGGSSGVWSKSYSSIRQRFFCVCTIYVRPVKNTSGKVPLLPRAIMNLKEYDE